MYLQSNIKFLCKKNNIKIKDLETTLSIRKTNLSRPNFYKNTMTVPTLLRIGNYFNVDINDLICLDLSRADSTYEFWMEMKEYANRKVIK